MKPLPFFEKIIGIEKPWKIESVTFDGVGTVVVQLEYDELDRPPVPVCPMCGGACSYCDIVDGVWRHTDMCDQKCIIHSKVPRAMCISCGNVSMIPAPWIVENDEVDEQLRTGDMYYRGKGVEQSYEEAMKWYRLAARRNDLAKIRIGWMYEHGEGVDVSYDEAAKWYRLAHQDVPSLWCERGDLFFFGDGVEHSYEEAMKWYRLAADLGDADAQCRVGGMYHHGNGVMQSYEEAMKWYRLAADQGDLVAQYYVGFLYEHGEGVEQSYEEAMKWYALSAEQGDNDAKRGIKRLNGKKK